MPELIEKGHVYIACPPLFELSSKTNPKAPYVYGYTLEELNNMDTTNYNVKYLKGLGEMNPDELWSSTMNPATRKLIQITVEDAEEANNAIEICMGKNVELRKNFIIESSNYEDTDNDIESGVS